MGGAYSMHERDDKFIKSLVRKLGKESLFGHLGVDGMIILKLTFKLRGYEVPNYMHLAQIRDQWRALLDTVTNL
jgi:hypothetical protein